MDPTTARAMARVGITLRDKWHLDTLIGVGGMAAVYAATHRNGKRVAVKMLYPEMSLDPNIRQRFLREGYVANKVAHPGAVSVIDDDTAEDGSVYLVMDPLEGETLDGRAQRFGGRIEVGEVLSLADQLLDVLAAAHDKGIVHRDLKPENVFVTREGQVKVLDFGIARLKELSGQGSGTKTGNLMGTPAYMPPEQARGLWDEVDARTDLWAVGATLYTLLTGQMVHQARTVNEQLLAAMTAQAPPISNVMPGLPSWTVGVVDKALSYQRQDRWQDARAMQEAVRTAYQEYLGAPISSAPRVTVPEEIALARTMASAPGISPVPGGPSTGNAMVSGHTGIDGTPRKSRLPLYVAVGAAAVVSLFGVVIALVATTGSSSRTSIAAASASADVQLTASSSAAIPSATVTAIAADQLPTVLSPTSSAKSPAATGKRFVAPAVGVPPPSTVKQPTAQPDMDKRR